MVITGVISIISLVLINHIYFTVEYCTYFIYFALWYLFIRFILKKNIKYVLMVFYIALFPIYAIGILMGSFFDCHYYYDFTLYTNDVYYR